MFRNFITSTSTIFWLFVISIAMFFWGGYMFLAKEVVITTITVPGTQGAYATIGAVGGGAVGATAGAAIGGVGIAACGTGVGIPVGIVCLALASVCAFVGGSAGSMADTASKTIESSQLVNAFQCWQYTTVWFVGVQLLIIAFYAIYLRHQRQNSQNTLMVSYQEK